MTASIPDDGYCVCCGAPVPEGWMVCWGCEHQFGQGEKRRPAMMWIEDEYGYYHCSACGFEWDEPEQTETVCPQCGAEAEGEILYD